MLKWAILGTLAIVMSAEVWVFLEVVAWIGTLASVGWILFSFILGLVLFRTEGIHLLFKVHRQLQQGIVPTRELVDGGAIIGGVVLLLAPGYVTDAIGLILLLRPTRWLVVAYLMYYITGRDLSSQWRGSEPGPPDDVIEIEPHTPDRKPVG